MRCVVGPWVALMFIGIGMWKILSAIICTNSFAESPNFELKFLLKNKKWKKLKQERAGGRR